MLSQLSCFHHHFSRAAQAHPGRRLHSSLCLLLIAVPLLLAGCNFGTRTSSPPYTGAVAHVKLALDWTPNTNHTGIYVAFEKGWYRQEGIDLTLLPYSSEVAPEQLVGTGQADFGISFTEGVTSARAAGEPVVSIAAIIQHNTSALISLKSSGLDTVAKLAGKRYAGFGAPYEQPVISQVLSCGGARSTSFQNVTTALDPIAALKSGQFDFAWVFMGWEGIEAQRQGLALNVFSLLDYCMPDYYSPVIITNQQLISQHGDVIRRFLKATAEGYTYAIAHPEDAANLLMQAAPAGAFDDKQLVYESQAYLSPRYSADTSCWGSQTLEKWTDYPRFMYTHNALFDVNNQLLARPPDYAAAFTSQFLPPC
jgi:ABC-type nitrate/sulfonate/bicarbonate transport system substrate-binding protein